MTSVTFSNVIGCIAASTGERPSRVYVVARYIQGVWRAIQTRAKRRPAPIPLRDVAGNKAAYAAELTTHIYCIAGCRELPDRAIQPRWGHRRPTVPVPIGDMPGGNSTCRRKLTSCIQIRARRGQRQHPVVHA